MAIKFQKTTSGSIFIADNLSKQFTGFSKTLLFPSRVVEVEIHILSELFSFHQCSWHNFIQISFTICVKNI